jgi:hypothetical protein
MRVIAPVSREDQLRRRTYATPATPLTRIAPAISTMSRVRPRPPPDVSPAARNGSATVTVGCRPVVVGAGFGVVELDVVVVEEPDAVAVGGEEDDGVVLALAAAAVATTTPVAVGIVSTYCWTPEAGGTLGGLAATTGATATAAMATTAQMNDTRATPSTGVR